MTSRRPVTALAVALAVMLGAAGTSLAAPSSLMSIESQYMCVSCHEPLELVSSPQAQSEKTFLYGLIKQGLSPSEIRRQMVGAYSVAVLGKPPATGFNLTVYILPPAILVLGVAFLLYTLPKWRERSRQAAATPLAGRAPLDRADAERLEDDLARFI